MTEPKRLMRDTQKGMIGGVCAGMAEYLDVDVTLVRVLYVVLSVVTAAFPGILVYILLWIIMPAKQPSITAPDAVAQQR